MGFLVSFSFFFLALVINQSTVVGQTTAESVIEFPKNDIRDVRGVIISSVDCSLAACPSPDIVENDIQVISLNRKNAVIGVYKPQWIDNHVVIKNIHYNNGVTEYNENWTSL
jgi:threonine dehydrogenase-like Zn-dependent dehydrogenase